MTESTRTFDGSSTNWSVDPAERREYLSRVELGRRGDAVVLDVVRVSSQATLRVAFDDPRAVLPRLQLLQRIDRWQLGVARSIVTQERRLVREGVPPEASAPWLKVRVGVWSWSVRPTAYYADRPDVRCRLDAGMFAVPGLPKIDAAMRLWLHLVDDDDRMVRVVVQGPKRFVGTFLQLACTQEAADGQT